MEEQYSWDTFEIPEEAVSDLDLKSANSMGRTPAGTFLVECVESTPKMNNMRAYSCPAVNLKFKILEVKKIGDEVVDAAEWEDLEGKFIWDTVNMYSLSEKQGMKDRRILVANRCGIVKDNKVTMENWANDIVGKRVILTTVEESYVKDGVTKQIVKVGFSGYEKASEDETSDVDPLEGL